MDTLVQLPNRDLWRGFDPNRTAKSNVDMTPAVAPTPAATQGTNLECMWCGFKGKDLTEVKDHVEKLHFAATHQDQVAEAAREFLTGPRKEK